LNRFARSAEIIDKPTAGSVDSNPTPGGGSALFAGIAEGTQNGRLTLSGANHAQAVQESNKAIDY
jgi:hypothetical protein